MHIKDSQTLHNIIMQIANITELEELIHNIIMQT